jgi:hypothetical protein
MWGLKDDGRKVAPTEVQKLKSTKTKVKNM